ncbi:MAG: response regulator [Chitinivibrionales bacterium]|nr:response regulator [Chitinivibrionales bacterium]MBD3357364.1 response regulator [Chitinivibrionales bacterium]
MAMARKKVLWVDDEIEFLRSHIMFLETRGYSVTPSFNGDDALQILKEKPKTYDIVLLDEQMPGKDGLSTLEDIKKSYPDLPVVMVTKSEEEQVMEDAFGRHIDGYLTKPVNPSQILSVCKRLLDSKTILSTRIAQRFMRNYSANRAALQNELDARDWPRLYENLTRWDLELENVDDEGLRQTHAGQKSDANVLFARHVTENYVEWTHGNQDPPILATQILDMFVVPRLVAGEKIALLAMDCLRLDQLMAVAPLLKKDFTLSHEMFYACMPTSKPFTRLALLSGLFPNQIYDRYPSTVLGEANDEGEPSPSEALLRDKLEIAGYEPEKQMVFAEIGDMQAGRDFLGRVGTLSKKKFIALTVDFIDLLIQSRSAASVVQQIAPDEGAFRRLTYSWFLYSNIYQIIKELGKLGYTIMLTAGNGRVLCTRGTELYGDNGPDKMVRFRCGEKVSCDERHALFIAEPQRFRLPAPTPKSTWLILRENYYFIHHDLFENYKNQYRNSFQNGGISLEEMIVPFVMLQPL